MQEVDGEGEAAEEGERRGGEGGARVRGDDDREDEKEGPDGTVRAPKIELWGEEALAEGEEGGGPGGGEGGVRGEGHEDQGEDGEGGSQEGRVAREESGSVC